MSSTKVELIAPQDLEASDTSKYTSPAGGKGSIIDEFTLCNYSGGAITVDIHIGTSVANATFAIKARSLASNATDALPELVGRYIKPGDSIYWKASAATSVAGHASGRELTS